MIRLFHVYYPARTLLLAILEALLVATAMAVAYFVWFGREAELALLYERGLDKAVLGTLVCMLCMYYYDLYDSSVLSNRRETLVRIMQVLGTTSIIMAGVFYIFPQMRLAQRLFICWVTVTGALLVASRRLFLMLNAVAHFAERTILLGEGPLAKLLANEIEKRPELGMVLVGYVSTQPEYATVSNGLRRLGSAEDLRVIVRTHRIAHVLVAPSERRRSVPVLELLNLKGQGLIVEEGADVYEAVAGKISLDSLVPSQLLFTRGFRLPRGMLIYKRTCSILGSLAAMVITAPILALIAAAVRLDSPGPIIFRQKRVGRGGTIFTLYKFRSMWNDTSSEECPRPARVGDDRITRVGRWLRRMRLDELPQLYNILRGDMHFIGPRPFTPNAEDFLAREIPFYSQRWMMRPGATGWAQIQYGYCETLEDNREKLSYDLFYMKNISIGLDCIILLQTIKILLLGRGAR
jgi:sugar transferase (PEP-CTERM system associated)